MPIAELMRNQSKSECAAMNRAFLASAATPALAQRAVPSHTGFGSNTIDRVQEIAPFFGNIAL